jgi:uncharacterized protein YdeI (YjbR/CyaY-like superfamily)
VVHYKRNAGKGGLSLEEGVEEAIRFGWIDDKLRGVDENRFMLRYTPRKPHSVWSKINKDRAERMIEEGSMEPSGMESVNRAKKDGRWDGALTNLIREALPPDLERALVADGGAWDNFRQFANSDNNAYVYWVNSARTEATRGKRIAEVVKRARRNEKRLA